MHLEDRKRLRQEAANDWLPRWLAVLFPFSIVGSVLGQSVLAPPPGFQNAPATPQLGAPSWGASRATGTTAGQNNSLANPSENNASATGEAEGQPSDASAAPAAAAPVESLMTWGALHLRGSATYQFLYSTGVHSAPGQDSDTITHTLTPSLTATLGPHVSLTYSPSFRFFSQRDFHNTIDHFVSLTAGARYGDWNFGLSQSFSRTDEPLVETSSQTDQENYLTGLDASYQFNDKISFDTSASMSFMVIGNNSTNVFKGGGTNNIDAPALSDSQSYSGSEFVDYQFSEALEGGLGVTVGYSAQDGGFKSLDEQYLGRVTWKPGAKFKAYLSGGMEDEQFLNTHAPDIVTPIFSASASYHLFEQTTVSLTAGRAVNASLFQSEVTESTQVGLGVQQRLLGKLQLSLGFGYGTTDYRSTTGNLVTTRSDESTAYSIGLGLPFMKHGNISTFYEFNDDSSDLAGFGSSTSQVGVVLSWAY